MSRNGLRVLAVFAALLTVALIALPVLGVDPTRSPSSGPKPTPVPPSPAASAATAPSAEPDGDEQGDGGKPDKAAKPDKAHTPEHPVTLHGVVGRTTDADGDTDYTLTVGSTVYRLSAGPRWWWGDASPLEAVVGKTVTVDGEQAEGSDEIDVLKIDGAAVREPGKPPWAGGWRVVGERHPGWAQWKVDKLAGRGLGRDGAPGHHEPDASPAP
jgi:hypothetical protein